MQSPKTEQKKTSGNSSPINRVGEYKVDFYGGRRRYLDDVDGGVYNVDEKLLRGPPPRKRNLTRSTLVDLAEHDLLEFVVER